MMEEKRVRDAVEGAKKRLTDEHLKVLIELAKAWLARKMPEKKEISPYLTVGQDGMAKGWNACLDACRFASVVSEEEIAKMIKDSDMFIPGVDDVTDLAHAIAERFNKGGDECVYSCQEVAHLKNIILELENKIAEYGEEK